jgi:hypothetical protein
MLSYGGTVVGGTVRLTYGGTVGLIYCGTVVPTLLIVGLYGLDHIFLDAINCIPS